MAERTVALLSQLAKYQPDAGPERSAGNPLFRPRSALSPWAEMTWSPAASTSPLPATAVLGVALLSLGLAEWHTPYLLLLALLAAVCLLCGAINGLLVLAAGLPPLLATLSTSVAFTGLTDLLTGQRRIAVSDPLMVAFRDNSVLGLPPAAGLPAGGVYPVPVPAPPLPLRPACAGGGRQSRYGADERPERAPLDPAGLAVSGHCRRAGYSAAAQPGAPAAQAGRPRRCCWRPCWRPLSAPPSRAVGWSPSGARCWGQSSVNALSNGLGLLGVNIFWMGAIKGGLILGGAGGLGGQTQRRRGMSQITLKTSASAEQTASSPLASAVAGRIWRHHPAGHRPVWLGESGIFNRG